MTIFSKNTSIKLLNIFLTELQQLDMFPCIGSELEFYLMPMDNNYNDNLWQGYVHNFIPLFYVFCSSEQNLDALLVEVWARTRAICISTILINRYISYIQTKYLVTTK